jgi:hypothetical protein
VSLHSSTLSYNQTLTTERIGLSRSIQCRLGMELYGPGIGARV